MQLILLVSFPNCVLFKQVLQQVFHHHIFYSSLSLSRVFLFESISRVHYISFTYGKIHRTFSLFIFVKATFLVSVSSVFIREKQAKGEGEGEWGRERKREQYSKAKNVATGTTAAARGVIPMEKLLLLLLSLFLHFLYFTTSFAPPSASPSVYVYQNKI